jgi:flagellar export protein FliJ
MKAFAFPLGRILEYRRQQAGVEQTRLETLLSQVRQLDEQIALLAGQKAQLRDDVRSGDLASGDELAAASRFEAFLGRQTTQVEKRKAEVQVSCENQRRVAVEAQRKVKLLERLRDRRMTEWTSACDRELEEIAAESHLARLMSERRLHRTAI